MLRSLLNFFTSATFGFRRASSSFFSSSAIASSFSLLEAAERVSDSCRLEIFRVFLLYRVVGNLVGCGDCSAAAHGKLWGISSIHKQSLVSFFSKYNTYGLPLSNEWCLAILVHRERPINQLSLSNCLDIKANPPFYTLEVDIGYTLLKMDQINSVKNRLYQKLILKVVCFLTQIDLMHI